jgi:predicted small secreted protein
MSFKRALVLAVASISVSACNTANTHIGDEDPGFGESVKYNAAIQTINPAPVYAPGGAQPGASGVKGQKAAERYRTDAVKPVETMQTTGGSSSGSSGSTPH